MRRHWARSLLAVLAGMLVLAAACGGDDATKSDASGGAGGSETTTPGMDGSITVFAAASLTDAFGDIKEAFEKANPGAEVTFNFAGSSALKDQILQGAPADVFASANQSNMDPVKDAGKAGDDQVFVTNKLEIAVPKGNPGKVAGLDAFGTGALRTGLCAEDVPCGEFGREALANAGVTPKEDTDEADVRALLTKVQSGDLEAGLVYVTDVLAGGDQIQGVEIPADQNVIAKYPIAALSGSKESATADAFVAFVLSPDGQKLLEKRGFTPAA
jgi:molybdate transport system substrate-binding protein